MNDSLTEELRQLNAELDGLWLLQKMGFTDEAMYQEGNIIRVFCPIHKDLVRKSLIVDLEKKEFSCQYAQCDAHAGQGRPLQELSSADVLGPLALSARRSISLVGHVAVAPHGRSVCLHPLDPVERGCQGPVDVKRNRPAVAGH